MQGDEARALLGFPPNSRPTPAQVKAAFRKKVWESHPDLFPLHEKLHAESRFKLISEAYTFLLCGNRPVFEFYMFVILKGIMVCKLPMDNADYIKVLPKCYCHVVKEMGPLRFTGYIDPGWEHGVAQDERKKKVKCNYCGKVVSGGIFRLKQHLARISGEVTHCNKAPEEVCLNMKKNLEGCCSGRKRRRPESEQALTCHSNEYSSTEESPGSHKWKGKKVMNNNSLAVNFAPLRSLGYVDPGWEHCIAQDEKKKRVKCIYCERIITGGINRFKQHLARIPGEVAYCKRAPEEVYLKIKENMKWHRTGRRNRKPESEEQSPFYLLSDNENEEEGHDGGSWQSIDDKVSDNDIRNSIKLRSSDSSSNGSEPLLRKSRLDSVFLKSLQIQTSSDHKQAKAKVGFQRKARNEVIAAISKFFYYAGIPSSAVNSSYFHKMLELVGQYGQGLHGPFSRLISSRFLQDEISTSKAYLAELRETWMTTGCSIMADSWNDLLGRTHINFLASCPRGLYFISSFDASDIIEDAGNLFKMLDKVVEEIGEENIVQVITKNTPSFRTAGKMLEEKRRHLFWTPCAVHSVDGMLEDFMRINGIGETIDKAKRITRLIYNSSWLLNLSKKEFIKGQELLKPAITKFGSIFFTLQSLLDQRIGLKRMFKSNKWICSQISKSDKGKEVERIVLNPTFWKKMQYVRKSLEPVAHVLQKMDNGESNSMPFIYNDMFRSKLAIKAIHRDDTRKYGPFWSVINSHLNLFHHPLYVAAYFLNPSYRYRPDFIMNPEVVRGLNECIVRLETDSGRRIAASMQIPDFVSAKVDFGTDLAISTRLELDPAAWWQQHGISCLELQRIAVHILSQTCSSIGCEHTWSMYDQLHSDRHNSCVSHKKWNELTYVHYNLRLREHQLSGKQGALFFDDFMMENILGDWVAEVEKQVVQEDEEIVYSENEMEHYGDEVDESNHEENKPAEVLTLVGVAEPMENNPAARVTTDDDSLDFLEDNMTE